MEKYDEGAYRCSRIGRADCQPDLCSARRAGLPRKASSFSRLINNFVSPDEPTSVTGGDTLFGSGIAAAKRPHVIEDRSHRICIYASMTGGMRRKLAKNGGRPPCGGNGAGRRVPGFGEETPGSATYVSIRK